MYTNDMVKHCVNEQIRMNVGSLQQNKIALLCKNKNLYMDYWLFI